MEDSLTEASARGTKGKTKFTLGTKKDNLSKGRTRVTKGISIDKNQTNSSFKGKGKKDLCKAIGKLKELTVNPSPQHVPSKSCELNLPDSDSDDDEFMQRAKKFLEGFHDCKLCCSNIRNERNQERIIERKTPRPRPPRSEILEEAAAIRRLYEIFKGEKGFESPNKALSYHFSMLR